MTKKFHLPPSLLDESLLLDIIEYLPAGVFAKDQDNDFRFVIWNSEMERIFANQRSDMLGKNDYDFFMPAEADYYRATDTGVMAGGTVIDIPQERVNTSKGEIIAHTIKVPVTLRDGRRILLGILEDITDKVHSKQQIEHYQSHLESLVENRTRELRILASTDMFTQLSNRTHFFETLNQYINTQSSTPLSLIYLDLDRFKLINDTYGHDFGDEILTIFGNRLLSLREQVINIARIGGDEFAILVNASIESKHVDAICQKISHIFDEKIHLNQRTYSIGGSMGLCGYPQDALNARQMLQRADMAMYHTKYGKQQRKWARFSDQMQSQSLRELEIEQGLKYAIQNRELFVLYQPQFSAADPTLMLGMEALVRWNSPSLGLVPPSVFIPISEITGFIHQISDFVMNQVCKDLTEVIALGFDAPRISINFSATELDENTAQRIESILEFYQLPPSLFTIEITENSKIKGHQSIFKQLRPLRARGMRISIDDFGTGYSSLAYISELEIDEIKIDQSFVQSALDNPKHESIVKAIIGIGQAFGYKIIAEGVETAAQLTALQQYDDLTVQGFLFSHPVKISATEQYFTRHTPQM